MEKQDTLYQIKSLLRIVERNYFQNNDDKINPTTTQMEIMHYIIKHQNENIYQKDLEKKLDIRRATISEVLKTMEKNNLIKRKINKKDLRSKEIKITEKAKEIFREKKEKMKNLNQKITKGITKEEEEIFIYIINKMKNNIRKGE